MSLVLHFHLSICLSPHFSVADRFRTPLDDWHEGCRKKLEKGAREARSVKNQQSSEPTSGLQAAGAITIEGQIEPY